MKSILNVLEINGRKATCKCECGTIKDFWLCDIEKGKIKSCGCLRYKNLSERNTKHGKCGTRIYRIWRGIISRCEIKTATSYENYGGRGISVCKEWHSFDCFYKWALENGYLDNLTIERINNNGNYEPKNCCWITKSEQSLNKRERKTKPKKMKKDNLLRKTYKAKIKRNGNHLFFRDWIEGSLIIKTIGVFIYVIEEDDFGNIVREFEIEVIPETVCQFTGLLDVNKNKIFHNDRIKVKSKIGFNSELLEEFKNLNGLESIDNICGNFEGVVVMDSFRGLMFKNESNGYCEPMFTRHIDIKQKHLDIEIIGNIHD